jgi:diaminopimelate epimerase
MTIPFIKYQGTGNDFIMIDNRVHFFLDDCHEELIQKLCDRRFGIGADGLIMLENDETSDFKMVYFNADGRQSTMCGNGGRCIIQFAHDLGVIDFKCAFLAIDGVHNGVIENGHVKLQMQDVTDISELNSKTYELNTGSPHYIEFVDSIPSDVKMEGARIRNSDRYKLEGININFVSLSGDAIQVATYERGVEDETYSCGTGVTAAAIAKCHTKSDGNYSVNVLTKGGSLVVEFTKIDGKYSEIWLNGPAKRVFEGVIKL